MLCAATLWLGAADELLLPHADLSDFRCESKRSGAGECSTLEEGKRAYWDRRGGPGVGAGRGARLRELEARLREERVLLSEWRAPGRLRLAFSSGLLCHLVLHPHTSHPTQILFDRYCVGKIPSNPTAAIFTDTHLLFAYAESLAALVSFNPPSSPNGLEKINSRDPNYQTIELYGPSRKCEKRLSVRVACGAGEERERERLLVWSTAPAGELFPWSPAVRGEDRANLHLYMLDKSETTLLCHRRLEHEPLAAQLSQLHHNLLYTVEQKPLHKSGVCVECCSYEAEAGGGAGGGLRARTVRRVALPAPARAACRSPCEARVALACIDGSLLVLHEDSGLTLQVKAAFIPCCVAWGADVLLASEERGRLQCFDLSLAPLRPHDDAKLLDLSQHLKRQCTLRGVQWDGGDARRPLFLVGLEGGPLALLTLTLADVARRRLEEGACGRLTALARALGWEREGDACLRLLHAAVNHLFRRPLTASSELQIQEALGSFHAPESPLSPRARRLYAAPLHDLSRKFFHHLLRYGRLEKALSLAVDLCDSDLFMDVWYAARRGGRHALAHEARRYALHALHELHALADTSAHSSCSRSCCSRCSSECGSLTDEEGPPPPPPPPPPRAPPPLPAHAPPRRHLVPPAHHKVVDIFPRPQDCADPRLRYGGVYQAELREEAPPAAPRAGPRSALASHQQQRAPEKNKVKFSDTVTVAVVPEIPRKERAGGAGGAGGGGGNMTLECGGARVTDPRKELLDSLPLCHPNRDYLRDFQPQHGGSGSSAASPAAAGNSSSSATPRDYVEL